MDISYNSLITYMTDNMTLICTHRKAYVYTTCNGWVWPHTGWAKKPNHFWSA